jgi:ABC-type nitrate/sulfonate/bicarbonate transport system substrate-binding protein
MRIRVLAALAAAATLALAGCAPSDGGNTGGDEVDLGTVRIIGIGVPDFTAVDVAKWQENLAEAGFTVDFKTVEEEDAALRAVVAGAADMYIGSLPSLITAVTNADAEVKNVAVNAQSSSYVVLANNDIEDLDDLAGQIVGVNTPGSAGDTIMRLALEAEGFDTDSPEYVVIGGSSARVAALQAGQIAATVAHIGLAESAIATGQFRALLYCGPALGPYLQTGLNVSNAYADENPEAMQAVVDAFIDAQRWAASEKDEYLELSETIDSETDLEIRDATYDSLLAQDFWGVDGGIDDESVENWLDISVEAGDLVEPVPATDDWLDNSYVLDYLERSGEF